MAPDRNSKKVATMSTLIVTILLVAVFYPSYAKDPQQSAPHLSEITSTPRSAWFELLQRSPYPFTIPLPTPTRTIIDGTYTKFELKETPLSIADVVRTMPRKGGYGS